jgi:hypothetical protein
MASHDKSSILEIKPDMLRDIVGVLRSYGVKDPIASIEIRVQSAGTKPPKLADVCVLRTDASGLTVATWIDATTRTADDIPC